MRALQSCVSEHEGFFESWVRNRGREGRAGGASCFQISNPAGVLRLLPFPSLPCRCIKKSLPDDPQKDDTAVASCSQSMWSFLEVSPDFAKLFYQLQSLPTERRGEVFDRVSKRVRSTTNV